MLDHSDHLFSAEELREIGTAVQCIGQACQRYSDDHPELDEEHDPALDLIMRLYIGLDRMGILPLPRVK